MVSVVLALALIAAVGSVLQATVISRVERLGLLNSKPTQDSTDDVVTDQILRADIARLQADLKQDNTQSSSRHTGTAEKRRKANIQHNVMADAAIQTQLNDMKTELKSVKVEASIGKQLADMKKQINVVVKELSAGSLPARSQLLAKTENNSRELSVKVSLPTVPEVDKAHCLPPQVLCLLTHHCCFRAHQLWATYAICFEVYAHNKRECPSTSSASIQVWVDGMCRSSPRGSKDTSKTATAKEAGKACAGHVQGEIQLLTLEMSVVLRGDQLRWSRVISACTQKKSPVSSIKRCIEGICLGGVSWQVERTRRNVNNIVRKSARRRKRMKRSTRRTCALAVTTATKLVCSQHARTHARTHTHTHTQRRAKPWVSSVRASHALD